MIWIYQYLLSVLNSMHRWTTWCLRSRFLRIPYRWWIQLKLCWDAREIFPWEQHRDCLLWRRGNWSAIMPLFLRRCPRICCPCLLLLHDTTRVATMFSWWSWQNLQSSCNSLASLLWLQIQSSRMTCSCELCVRRMSHHLHEIVVGIAMRCNDIVVVLCFNSWLWESLFATASWHVSTFALWFVIVCPRIGDWDVTTICDYRCHCHILWRIGVSLHLFHHCHKCPCSCLGQSTT